MYNGGHQPDKCAELHKGSVEERIEITRSKGLCFGCLKKGHQSKNCRARLICEKCGRQHPTSLHIPNDKEQNKGQQSTPQLTSSHFAHSHQTSSEVADENANSKLTANVCSVVDWHSVITNSLIIPVFVHHKNNPGNKVMIYALLDDASDTKFITTNVKEKLGIPGVSSKLILSTMLGREEVSVSRVDGLIVERIDQCVQVELPKTYSRDRIPSRRDQIPRPEVATAWPHLKKIEDKIMPYQEEVEVGLLIGCNCPKAIKPKEVIVGRGDDPYAVRTLLGWGIIGPVSLLECEESDREEQVASSCNRIIACEVDTGHHNSSRSFVFSSQSKEEITPFSVKRMFEQDFSDRCSNDPGLSKEDRRFLTIAREGITQLENEVYLILVWELYY